MAKQIPIKMNEIRRSEKVDIPSIPINIYAGSISDSVQRYGEEKIINVLYDMLLIREFETMIDSIKKMGEYEGIPYKHLGPAHLSIGQESSAVGQSLALDKEDLIFGSHRSHGEIMAKSFSCINKMKEHDLQHIMERYNEGSILKVMEAYHAEDSLKELGINFILYGLLAEIFARENGVNKGLGGSMHAFFVPFGSMPNNAIVGGSADIALGAALYKKINDKKGIVIGNIGDSAMACGPVWEALCFSAMDQYYTLWEEKQGGPPYMLNIFNNFYGMGGQSRGETMGMEYSARIGAGVNKYNMHAERVDGFNPLAVADAVERKKEILLEGKGPVLMDTITYRISGHSPSDASSYRTKEEIDEFVQKDAIIEYKNKLIQEGLLTESNAQTMAEKVKSKIKRTFELVIDTNITPYVSASIIEPLMYSHSERKIDTTRTPDTSTTYDENSRVVQLKTKERYAYNKEGKAFPAIKLYTLRDAIFESVIQNAFKNPDLIIYGEENRDWGGAFACYRGLTESLPYHRLFNSSISEGAIVGTGVGYALSGGTALVELMYCDFLGRAGDEVFNQMPKWQSMSGGELKMPLTVRVSVGDKYGAQHSQDWSALLGHIPGLMVMFPATPYDAKGMLHYALTHEDPVVFIENQQLYGIGEMFYQEGVPQEEYVIPLGEPAIRKTGTDLTIITIGTSLYNVLKAEDELSNKYGISVEIIDLRFINPLNYTPLIESIKKTGKVLLVSTATERGSFMHTVASNLSEKAFEHLDRAPCVIGARNWISPPAELEKSFFPNNNTILDTINQNLIVLEGYIDTSTQTREERLRRNKLGV